MDRPVSLSSSLFFCQVNWRQQVKSIYPHTQWSFTHHLYGGEPKSDAAGATFICLGIAGQGFHPTPERIVSYVQATAYSQHDNDQRHSSLPSLAMSRKHHVKQIEARARYRPEKCAPAIEKYQPVRYQRATKKT